jgi:hypothetical protein
MSYWIKLWTEVLDDPKMGQLPDHLWRRAIEMFLFAGKMQDDGRLPPLNDMAWTLRCSTDELVTDLLDLLDCDHGILSQDEEGWFMVRKFADRQAPVSNAERQQRHRVASQKSNELVTICDNPVTKNVTHTEQNRTDPETDPEQNRADTETDNRQQTDAAVVAAVSLLAEAGIDGIPDEERDGWKHPELAYALIQHGMADATLKNWRGWVRDQMRKGKGPPARAAPPGNGDSPADRRRYVEGKYAAFIEH